MTTFILLALTTLTQAIPLQRTCEITSELVPDIKVVLKERTPFALHGTLLDGNKTLGSFKTSRPKVHRPSKWTFAAKGQTISGTSLLFKNEQLWSQYTRIPKSHETNRLIFVDLASSLYHGELIENDRNLLVAASGFWSISDGCLGGRMLKAFGDLMNDQNAALAKDSTKSQWDKMNSKKALSKGSNE